MLHTVWQEELVVDFMLGILPFEREALDRATSMSIKPGLSAKVAHAEDLLIMKLIASRERDFGDIAALKELYPAMDVHRIRSTVSEYAEALDQPDLLDNLSRFFPDRG